MDEIDRQPNQQKPDSDPQQESSPRLSEKKPKLNTEESGSSTYNPNTKKKPRPESTTNWLMAIATLAIAVSTIFYTYYSHNQWNVLKDQAEGIKGQLDVMQEQLTTMKKQADNISNNQGHIPNSLSASAM